MSSVLSPSSFSMPSSVLMPSLPVPPPLRASEIPSFINFSVVVRLPDIARRTLKENALSNESIDAIQTLIDEIPNGAIRQVNTPLAPDAGAWAEYIRPYVGQNWLEVPWFFAEEYFYLRILEATGFYQEGPGRLQDPFAGQKKLGLASSQAATHALTGSTVSAEAHADGPSEANPSALRQALASLLLTDLWGNQNDLSMWPVTRDEQAGGLTGGSAVTENADAAASAQKMILSNDLNCVLDYLTGLPHGGRIDLLLDNAAYELVTDLALADFLLVSGLAGQVTLHVKSHPVFVSDALDRDVHETIDQMYFDAHDATSKMALRLRRALVDRSLSIQRHPFWTSPLAAWEMPKSLCEDLAQASLLISKGDANYRRLLGDRHWAHDLPFAGVVDYFPCPLLALRTLKSEITVGVSPAEAARAAAADKDWMINGRWGLIQFAPGK